MCVALLLLQLRWNWLHSPMHAAGFLLDPEYHHSWTLLQQDPHVNKASIFDSFEYVTSDFL